MDHEQTESYVPPMSDAEYARVMVEAHSRAGSRAADGRAVNVNPLARAHAHNLREQPAMYMQGNGDAQRMIPLGGPGVATRMQLNLAEFVSNSLQDDNVYSVNNVDAGQVHTLDPVAVLKSRSVALASGVTLQLAHPRNDALIVASGDKLTGLAGMYRDSALVRRPLPAQFSDIADGATVAASPLPFKDVSYSWPEVASAAFSTVISRAADKAVGGGEFLFATLLNSVLFGLAEYLDRVVYKAMSDAAPVAFTHALAAAQHLRIADLVGVVGTAGAGAGYNGAGDFIVNPGIRADLSAQTAGSFIYAPGTIVAALWPTIDILVSRAGALNGDVTVTCFASAQCPIADKSVIWTAGA
ncbi:MULTISPECIES: hypothetical protein [Burkholderia]|uniref:hypothetical protein n=1 Tax=Burkholderia TaxID=32008 RepID=UPI000841D3CA|nr:MULTISPECIES: hypothetical protein [unclassified Burkholderia]AOK29867.1 hypothetical protein AQ611_10965 [Burkholderia sp. Bp7605]